MSVDSTDQALEYILVFLPSHDSGSRRMVRADSNPWFLLGCSGMAVESGRAAGAGASGGLDGFTPGLGTGWTSGLGVRWTSDMVVW